MSHDETLRQSDESRDKSRSLSIEPTRPPSNVPGYSLEKFLGSGAYGEVWSAINQKTSRKVAIKFYTQRSASDIQQLAQEVEKLVVLSADRYVVQLLDVGWQANPPYYVMDFIEHGSLEDKLLKQPRLPADQAVDLFEEMATAMMHLHGKGILHCDLKPANILLDQDGKPRVADFGQSRLSTEDAGALGTLYYMSPEQADLDAVPDARWDVYGLGAMLYRMLTGQAPYRDKTLSEKIESSAKIGDRLEAYRTGLKNAPSPTAHRSIAGVDRALADIVSRCIAADPKKRFPTIQSVLSALRGRANRRARRPLLVLGILGPLLLMGVMSLFGSWAFRQATSDTRKAVIDKANESNHFKAQLAARSASERIQEYFRVVQQLAEDKTFLANFENFRKKETSQAHRATIGHPSNNTRRESTGRQEVAGTEVAGARIQLRNDSDRLKLKPELQRRLKGNSGEFPPANSWLLMDRAGNQICSVFKGSNTTELNNYAYRTYFTGLDADLDFSEVDADIQRRPVIQKPHLSAIFKSKATNTWKVAFSAPLIPDPSTGVVQGIVAVSVELGDFIDFENEKNQYVMMVDDRVTGPRGTYQGTVLEHPLLHEFTEQGQPIPESLTEKRVKNIDEEASGDFHDPMRNSDGGDTYRRLIFSSANVLVQGKSVTTQASSVSTRLPGEDDVYVTDTGWRVLAVEDFQSVILPVNDLSRSLWNLLLVALVSLVLLAVAMWWFVTRVLAGTSPAVSRLFGTGGDGSWQSAKPTATQTDRGNPRSGS